MFWCVFRFRFRFYSRLGKEAAEEARPSPPPLTRAEAARPKRSREIRRKRGAHAGLVGGVGARPVGEVGVEKKSSGGGVVLGVGEE